MISYNQCPTKGFATSGTLDEINSSQLMIRKFIHFSPDQNSDEEEDVGNENDEDDNDVDSENDEDRTPFQRSQKLIGRR